jgi:hypothetical protein
MKGPGWVRWHWPDGWGRWHVIASESDGVATLACGRTRKPPKQRTDRPSERLCPTCERLDDLRLSYTTEVTTEPLTIAIGQEVLA